MTPRAGSRSPAGSRMPGAALVALLGAGAIMVLLDHPASLTDEDDYMPHALDDLVRLRNPYATEHEETRSYETPFRTVTYSWRTTYPYLPALAALQLPGVDYRWTALAAYGALLWALRDRRVSFLAFGNPLVLWLAASGFNDFVPLALLAWSARRRQGWPAWLACASKQFLLPLHALDCALRRRWRDLALAALATLAVIAPFALLDPAAFWSSAVAVHLAKAPNLHVHWNYLLYPLYAATVTWPAARGRGAGAPAEAPA